MGPVADSPLGFRFISDFVSSYRRFALEVGIRRFGWVSDRITPYFRRVRIDFGLSGRRIRFAMSPTRAPEWLEFGRLVLAQDRRAADLPPRRVYLGRKKRTRFEPLIF